jgi:hypothetical protein
MTAARRPLLLSSLVWLAILHSSQAEGDVHAQDVDSALQRYVGTYRYIGGAEEIRALDAAIEEVVSQMNFLIRGIARRRLREPNLPSEKLIISSKDEQIRIDRPGQPAVSAPADGRPITWRHPEDGDVFEVQHGIDERGVLYQRFKGERSVSRNRFVFPDDGESLIIHTEIEADRLPAPLRFKMTYRRLRASGS